MPNIKEGGVWNKTIEANERLQDLENFEEPDGESKHGYVRGKNGKQFPLIGRDIPILGGAYAGAGEREIIVVNDPNKLQEHGEPVEAMIEQAYQEFKAALENRAHQENQTTDAYKAILDEAYAIARQYLPYSNPVVEKIVAQNDAQKDGLISLEKFMGKGGVCRHQALLVASFLERMNTESDRTLPQPRVSVDRNSKPGVGGHAWVRFTSPENKVYIVDPAQEYVGLLSEVPERDEKGRERWDYRRPEDIEAAMREQQRQMQNREQQRAQSAEARKARVLDLRADLEAKLAGADRPIRKAAVFQAPNFDAAEMPKYEPRKAGVIRVPVPEQPKYQPRKAQVFRAADLGLEQPPAAEIQRPVRKAAVFEAPKFDAAEMPKYEPRKAQVFQAPKLEDLERPATEQEQPYVLTHYLNVFKERLVSGNIQGYRPDRWNEILDGMLRFASPFGQGTVDVMKNYLGLPANTEIPQKNILKNYLMERLKRETKV